MTNVRRHASIVKRNLLTGRKILSPRDNTPHCPYGSPLHSLRLVGDEKKFNSFKLFSEFLELPAQILDLLAQGFDLLPEGFDFRRVGRGGGEFGRRRGAG
jgi:hypothetical protein